MFHILGMLKMIDVMAWAITNKVHLCYAMRKQRRASGWLQKRGG